MALTSLVLLASILPFVAPQIPGVGLLDKRTKPVEQTWVFFTLGTGDRAKFSAEDIQKMQTDHVGNLGRLYNEGTTIMAGPTGEANPIRGIVLLHKRTPEQLKADFAPDPFVKHGFLQVESFTIKTNKRLIGKADEPFVIEKNLIVLLKRAPDAEDSVPFPEIIAKHQAHLSQLLKEQKISFYASAEENKQGVLGILILPTEDAKKAVEMAERDPLVREGLIEWRMYPQWMGKGLIKRPAAKG